MLKSKLRTIAARAGWGRPPATKGRGPVGTLDGYHDGTLLGWAWTPDDPNARLQVELVLDGTPGGCFLADVLRPDLRDAGMGDGRHGFAIPICHYARDNVRAADLRLADGSPVHGAPIDLVSTLHAHKRQLRELLSSAPFFVNSFTFDGRCMETIGGYYPLASSLADARILLDGVPADEITLLPLDRKRRHDFWFLDPEASGFRARFGLGGRSCAESDAFTVSVLNPREPFDPLQAVYIPISARDFTNIPDASRMRRVSRQDTARFVFSGRSHFERNRMLAQRYGKPMEPATRLLDWGVGCGAIARHLLNLCPRVELHGIDIDADNIAWCKAHLPGGCFEVGPLLPPLSFPDDHFDLVYANSVFTHLTEAAQDAWLPELARILRPGGLVLATFHGEAMVAYERSPLDWITRWNERGIADEALDGALAGVIADDHYYRTTFHTREYINRHWSKWVDIRGVHSHIYNAQDVVIFAKK